MILKISNFCAFALFLATISLQSFGMVAEDGANSVTSSRPVSSFGYLASLKTYVYNFMASNYYMTSVVGYASYPRPIGKFFENLPDPERFSRDKKLLTRTESDVATVYSSIEYFKREEAGLLIIAPYSVKRYVTIKGYDENFRCHPWVFPIDDLFSHDVSALLNEFSNEAAHKKLIIHGHARTQGMVNGFSRKIFGSGNHICQITLQIDPSAKEMLVEVIDSVSKRIDQGFGSSMGLRSNCEIIEEFFSKVASDLSWIYKLKYVYREDQILNLHDCGRFSTIYFLARLEGKDPQNLSAEDIYRGFKVLERGGYEDFHQEEGKGTPSLFSRVCAPRRWLTDLFFSLIG